MAAQDVFRPIQSNPGERPREVILRIGIQGKGGAFIPVNRWFEWRHENGQRQPYWIRPEDTGVFSLAGIWEAEENGSGSIATFVILTTEAAPGIADVDRRQTVILDDEGIDQWLEPGTTHEDCIATVRKRREMAYDRGRVTRKVNEPLNDSPDLLVPLTSRQPLPAASAIA